MKQPSPRPSGRRRPPYALLPLLLLIWAGVLWGMVGCGMTGPFGGRDDSGQQIAAALAALEQGDTRAADNALERAARSLTQPGQAPGAAFAGVGRILIQRGQGTAAARFLARAVQQKELSWDPLVWSALSDAYTSANNLAAAQPAAQEADRRAGAILQTIGKSPNATDATQEAGRQQMEAGLYYSDVKKDPARALKALREAYRLLPENPSVLNALGYTLADLGTTPAEFDEAVILTRLAARLQPNDGSILDSYGWALFKRGDIVGARRVLREATDLVGEMPEVHYHLAMVYARLNQNADALRELNLALQIRPQYKEAEQAKANLPSPRP